MDVSRPAVSQHLKILKAARLVTDRAEGTRRLYSVDTRDSVVGAVQDLVVARPHPARTAAT